MKIENLSPEQLDRVVASIRRYAPSIVVCEECSGSGCIIHYGYATMDEVECDACQGNGAVKYISTIHAPKYSSDWAVGGPIIDEEHIWLTHHVASKMHGAHKGDDTWFQQGETSLIAAMRCYITSKLGKHADLTDILL